MDKILVQNAGKYEGQKVKLNGWVYNSRRSGKIGFLLFRDGTGIMQCIVVKNEVGEELFDEFKKLTQETSVSIEGEIVKNGRAPGGFELSHTGQARDSPSSAPSPPESPSSEPPVNLASAASISASSSSSASSSPLSSSSDSSSSDSSSLASSSSDSSSETS